MIYVGIFTKATHTLLPLNWEKYLYKIMYLFPSHDPDTDLNMDEIAQVKYLLNEVHRWGRVTRRKIEQIIQDVKQKRRKADRERGRGKQNFEDWISP